MADRIAGCERKLREAGNKEARHTDLACMEEKGVHVTTMGYRLEKEGRLAVAQFGDTSIGTTRALMSSSFQHPRANLH